MYWFTSIFAAIFTAILIFMGQIKVNENTNPGPILLLTIFGFILSVIGFFMVIAFSLGHQNYIMNVVVILCCWEKSEFYRDWEKPVHYKTWHRLFFEITITLFATLSLYYLSQAWGRLAIIHENLILTIVAFVIIFVLIEVLYRSKWKKEFDNRKEVIKELFPRFQQKIDDPKQEAKEIKSKIAELCNSRPTAEAKNTTMKLRYLDTMKQSGKTSSRRSTSLALDLIRK